jgi:hypothetical protein
MAPDVSVVIPSFNTRELTAQCVASVLAHTSAPGCEVLVIDNGSADGSAEALRQRFPGVAVHANAENLGFARAANQGLRLSRAPFVVLLNSDAYLTDDAPGAMVRHARADDRIGALGCRVRNADGSHQPSAGRFPTLPLEVSDQFLRPLSWMPSRWRGNCVLSEDFPHATDVDWIAGSCLLLRRAALDEVGPLDEQFTFGEEDIDLGARLRQAGWRVVYDPGASVVHLGGRSRVFNPDAAERFFEGRYRLYAKHRGRLTARLYRQIVLASIAARWLAAERRRLTASSSAQTSPNPYARTWLSIRRW